MNMIFTKNKDFKYTVIKKDGVIFMSRIKLKNQDMSSPSLLIQAEFQNDTVKNTAIDYASDPVGSFFMHPYKK